MPLDVAMSGTRALTEDIRLPLRAVYAWFERRYVLE
jgi:hypothetical protein